MFAEHSARLTRPEGAPSIFQMCSVECSVNLSALAICANLVNLSRSAALSAFVEITKRYGVFDSVTCSPTLLLAFIRYL